MTGPWRAACPACRRALGELPLEGPPLVCQGCGNCYACTDGIWRFLLPQDASDLASFLADYRTVRRAEERGSDDPAYYRRLPHTAADDRLAWQWAIRARTWRHLVRHHLGADGGPLRVADLGAGVGWFANRVVAVGHDAIAVDLEDDPHDGLGAARHFETSFPRVQASFDRLPLADGQCDLVVYNASFPYTTDAKATLAEGLRLLRPGGAILIVDSPIYRRDASGRQMAAERHADFEARFGTRSDRLPSIEYLTDELVDHLARELDVVWRRGRPWYGWRWAVRPVVAKLRRRREPSRFHVLEARPRRTTASPSLASGSARAPA
jgi:SAM-dependent methyltransferase